MLHIVIFVGLAALVGKLYKPTESNMLFDGASLVLYMCGITVYIANIVKGLRLVSEGRYGPELAEAAGGAGSWAGTGGAGEGGGEQILGREDSLKVLSASNTILALVLVGVLVLQAGQWYADRKAAQEAELMDGKEREERAKAGKKKST